MHRTLQTLGNEKDQNQIKFYKKTIEQVNFLVGNKKSQNNLLHSSDWASAQK